MQTSQQRMSIVHGIGHSNDPSVRNAALHELVIYFPVESVVKSRKTHGRKRKREREKERETEREKREVRDGEIFRSNRRYEKTITKLIQYGKY